MLGHLIARQNVSIPDEFWRQIRNPHLFVFDASDGLRWIGERTFDGSPGLMTR